jgi:hypothetical protein
MPSTTSPRPTRGRPRIAPEARYPDEMRIWAAVYYARTFRLNQPTVGKAIQLVHRLNACRAQMRQENALSDGTIAWDGWVVRRVENVVLIVPREQLDLSGATDINGNPIHIPSEVDIMPRNKDLDLINQANAIDRNEASPPPDMSRPLIDRD